MAKRELDVQMMSLADLNVLSEVAGNLADHYKKEGLQDKADKWAYNRAICINALEHRVEQYFEE